MISIILFFAILLVPPLFLAVCRGKRFEESIAVTTGSMILFMFFCGIIGILKFSVYMILGITGILLGLSVVIAIRRKHLRALLAPFFTPAFLAFALMYLFLLFVHYGRVLHEFDEFTHWGDVVKAMCCIDDFSTSPLSHSYFQNYVPGMALFQYLFEKIAMIFSHYYADWRLYFSYHLLAFVFLLPFFTIRKWRFFIPAFVLIIFTAVSPAFLSSESEYLTSIYVDGFVGLLAGSGFALLFMRKRTKTNIAHLLVICSLLVLVKDIGMLFAVVLGMASLLAEMLQNRKNTKRLLSLAGLTVVAVALPKILWEISIKVNHVTMMKFRRPIDLNVLFRVIMGQESGHIAEIPGMCFSRMLTEPIGLHGIIGIKMIYPVLTVLLAGMLFLGAKCWAKAEPELKKQRMAAAWSMILALVIYCLGMPLLYMFRLNSNGLPSFDRYMSIVFECFAAMVFLLFACWIQERLKWREMAAGFGACLVIVLLTMNPVLTWRYLNRESVSNQHYRQALSDELVYAMQDLAGGEEKHVWIITQEMDGTDFWTIRYGIRPSNGEVNVGFSISAGTKRLYPGDMWTIIIGAEEWKEKLKDYDYVMIYHANDSFEEDYGMLFLNPGDIGDNTIFAVNHDTDLMERVY